MLVTPERDAVGDGRGFIASTGRVSLSVAGNFRALLTAGTKDLWVLRLVTYSTGGSPFAKVHIAPTAGLPTDVKFVNNSYLGHPGDAGGVSLKADTNATTALSGGTDSGLDFGVFSGRSELNFLPMRLPAGYSLGVNVPFSGAADVACHIYFTV